MFYNELHKNVSYVWLLYGGLNHIIFVFRKLLFLICFVYIIFGVKSLFSKSFFGVINFLLIRRYYGYSLTNHTLQLYWNHTLAWVFSCKFAAYFQNTLLDGCFWRMYLHLYRNNKSIPKVRFLILKNVFFW